jgi:hypothetical protein
MKQVVLKIEELAREEDFDVQIIKKWSSKNVNVMDLWSKVRERMHPYLASTHNKDKRGHVNSDAAQNHNVTTNVTTNKKDKSRNGQILWRMCYNKIYVRLDCLKGVRLIRKLHKLNKVSSVLKVLNYFSNIIFLYCDQ